MGPDERFRTGPCLKRPAGLSTMGTGRRYSYLAASACAPNPANLNRVWGQRPLRGRLEPNQRSLSGVPGLLRLPVASGAWRGFSPFGDPASNPLGPPTYPRVMHSRTSHGRVDESRLPICVCPSPSSGRACHPATVPASSILIICKRLRRRSKSNAGAWLHSLRGARGSFGLWLGGQLVMNHHSHCPDPA
ncbi:hypothetical protein BX600DRAFT_274851 [Xylariales sp. PMI_506]|nr:hypothetical protein BX600DRAFT_274851 [Xylariales sp. PMI_506]